MVGSILNIEGREGLVGRGDRRTRTDLLDMLETAVTSIDPYGCVRESLEFDGTMLLAESVRIDIDDIDNIIVVGGGKAAIGMARAVDEILGARITKGIINVLEEGMIGNIRMHRSTHPHPSEEGRNGAVVIREMCEDAGENDLVICLVTGGGSAMIPLPPEGVDIWAKRRTAELLMLAGADIGELNTVRKHLSLLKGGNLARAAYPARVLALIMSDVVGDHLESICSGPTVPDTSTFGDAIDVLGRYGLKGKVPASVLNHLEAGEGETPKPGDPIFRKVSNIIVASNRRALLAAQTRARELGYSTLLLTSSLEGEAREAGKVIASIGSEIAGHGDPVPPPAVVLAGGETTVTVRGNGHGGRNTELALGSLSRLEPGVTLLSFGTDGVDGNSRAGGAIADRDSLTRDMGTFLENNDSAGFFEREGGLIVTGPTGTNVGDIVLLAVRKQ